jgi:phosphoribosylformimino-5-aminoimidazole carboxamide ribotide isomerase
MRAHPPNTREGVRAAVTLFRPCIDLHEGCVKQIVGGSLTDSGQGLKTNFVADRPAEWFATRYREDGLRGGHVIKLGPGNDEAARAALAAWPGGLHLGGGVTDQNAKFWLDAGAEKVIVTSWLFPQGAFSAERLAALSRAIGAERLVVDLSCRRRNEQWFVAIDRWRTITNVAISEQVLASFANHCSEFLIHAADVEGLCSGIDEELTALLGQWSPLPCTYAGGAKDISDLELVEKLSGGRVDLTFGSALDLFGGAGVAYADCLRWNRRRAASRKQPAQ